MRTKILLPAVCLMALLMPNHLFKNPVLPVYADGCNTDDPNREKCIQSVRYPRVRVAGQEIGLPSYDCEYVVTKALAENRLIDVKDPECRHDMEQALDIQRNEVLINPTKPAAVGTPMSTLGNWYPVK